MNARKQEPLRIFAHSPTAPLLRRPACPARSAAIQRSRPATKKGRTVDQGLSDRFVARDCEPNSRVRKGVRKAFPASTNWAIGPMFGRVREVTRVGSAPAPGVEEVSSEVAWERLRSEAASVLVDVRTQAEWNFVGVPDLNELSKEPILVEWQSFPTGQANPAFAPALSELLDARGIDRETSIFFLCRSGGRSRSAASAMIEAGYTKCINVSDGFEGPLDGDRHRSSISGWKHAGLPWVQG